MEPARPPVAAPFRNRTKFVFHQLVGDTDVVAGIHTAANCDSDAMLRFAKSFTRDGLRCRVYHPCVEWWDNETRRWRRGQIVHETRLPGAAS